MDINKKEVELAQQIEVQAHEATVHEMRDLQLLLIGGGNSVDIFH